jgi:hypothetical protein
MIGERLAVLNRCGITPDDDEQRLPAEHPGRTGITERRVRIGAQVGDLARILIAGEIAVAVIDDVAVVARRRVVITTAAEPVAVIARSSLAIFFDRSWRVSADLVGSAYPQRLPTPRYDGFCSLEWIDRGGGR